MSSYRDTIHLCFLAFSFDQMTWTLSDFSVRGACKERDRKFTKSPWRSLILQPKEKVLNLESKKFTSPAPQIKRATQHRRPRHMAGSRRKRAEAFPLRLLLSLQHLLVTCSLPVVSQSPHTWESNWEVGKLVKQLVWIPEFQLCFFLIRLFHHFLKKKKKSVIHQ